MDKIKLYFPLEEGEDAVDKYEALLFEDKQYFTTKPVHPTLFENRLTKMHKREEAYRSIVHEPVTPFVKQPLVYSFVEGHLLDSFKHFQHFQNGVYRCIYAARSVNEVEYYVRRLLESYFAYSQPYNADIVREFDVDAKLGQPLEVMKKLELLQVFEEKGGEKPQDLLKMDFDEKEVLMREFKRLSLLAKLAE